jgi:hypothetical protein
MKSLFTLLACATACVLSAQITFQESYGGGAYFEYALSAVPVSSGGYVCLAHTDSGAIGGLDYMLIRTDANGIEQWRRFYGTSDWEIGTGIIETNDGGFAICGGWNGIGTDSATLIKTDANGNVQWQNVFMPQAGRSMSQDLVELSDGSIVVTGFSGPNATLDGFVCKFSSTGNLQWQKIYGGASLDEMISIAEVNGTGFVMTGRTDSYGAGQSDYWIVRIDGSGDTLWTRAIGTAQDEESFDVVTTQDGGFAVYGNQNYNTGDGILMKLDGAGGLLWTRYFDGGSGGWDLGRSLTETFDGGFALAGRSESPNNYNHMWLVRTDASGMFMWQRTYPRDLFSNGEDICRTADGGFLITGYTGNQSGDPGNAYMVKTESAGWVGVNELAATFDFILSTDAATATLTLRFDEAVSAREIRIMNMEGKEILFLREEELLVEISTWGWARGVYVANVVSGRAAGSRKFVVN